MITDTSTLPSTHLKPYPAMKDSGVPWLGEVPEHWEIKRGKNLFRCIDIRSSTGNEELLTVSSNRGVVPRSSATVTMFKAESYVGYKLCWPGDLVINSLWAWAGGLGVSRRHGIVSSAYGVYRLRAPFTDCSSYIHELVRSTPFQWELQVRSKGIWISRLQLTDIAFLEAPFPLPPPGEQSAIVRFLDHYNRKIRHYIRAKQKLIKLLEEQKQAIIHQAVTRGLDPNVRLKPSGVEWLGDVPEHWEVRKLGQIAVSFRTGPFGSILHQSDYVEGGTPVINPTHMTHGNIVEDTRCSVPLAVTNRLSNYRLDKYDLIFSRRGELGRCALVRGREVGWLCGTGTIRVRIAYESIEPEYLIQSLQVRWVGEYLSLISVGATMDSLNTGILKEVPVLLPPVNEQPILLKHIAKETCNIDRVMADALRQISLLQEYRTRLIADVVTGKVDVRKAATYLPDEAKEEESFEEPEELGENDGAEEQQETRDSRDESDSSD